MVWFGFDCLITVIGNINCITRSSNISGEKTLPKGLK